MKKVLCILNAFLYLENIFTFEIFLVINIQFVCDIVMVIVFFLNIKIH